MKSTIGINMTRVERRIHDGMSAEKTKPPADESIPLASDGMGGTDKCFTE